MADFERFSLDRLYERPQLKTECPKCGGKGVQVNYCTTEHAGQTGSYGYIQGPQHLDLTCQWCGYVRFMLTKDYGVRPVQERNVTA